MHLCMKLKQESSNSYMYSCNASLFIFRKRQNTPKFKELLLLLHLSSTSSSLSCVSGEQPDLSQNRLDFVVVSDCVLFVVRLLPRLELARVICLTVKLSVASMSEAKSSRDSIIDDGETENAGTSAESDFIATPRIRELRTPHSGYHFGGTTRKFFEGWYFKVSIPERKQSFCFMYSVQNPAFRRKLSPSEVAKYGHRFTGVGAQILGAHGKYLCHSSEESDNFWADRHEMKVGNTFAAARGSEPLKEEVPPQEFTQRCIEGFQVTPLWHQGFITDDGRSSYVETVKSARWQYSTRPVYGWGGVGSKQNSTASWLAAFSLVEPHWQICMAAGHSTGWIEWEGERFEFQDAPSYCEKNWGGGFPKKWFWMQCNAFKGASGEISLTAVGGTLKQLPGFSKILKNAALIGVHYNGIFYEFVPWNGVISWEVAPWGYWYMTARNKTHLVEVEARTINSGTILRAPTMEAGLVPACRETCSGELRLKLWERNHDDGKGQVILDVTSDMAAVEIGGGPWFKPWKSKTVLPKLVQYALNVPINLNRICSSPVPCFRPPGL